MQKGRQNQFVSWLKAIVFTIIIALLVKNYVFGRIHVNGSSMMPILNNNDSVLIEKILLLTGNFKRGQIIICNFKNENADILIKRIIGIEDDEIQLIEGKVYINGKVINEPYIDENTVTVGGTYLHEKEKIKVEKGFVFLLGDNRSNSDDSRYFGPIKINTIEGHVVLKIFPLNKIKLLS